MSNPIIDVINKAWDLPEIVSCERVDSFSSNVYLMRAEDGRVMYLKMRPGRDEVKRESDLLTWLSSESMPTAPPILSTLGEPFVQTNNGVYALYPALPGGVADNHYNSGCIERAYAYGAGIALLHTALARYPRSDNFQRLDIPSQISSSVRNILLLHSSELRTDHLPETMEFTADYLDLHQHSLQTHLIHRDIHPANMLMIDNVVTGYLDFDIACIGPRIFDPCYCLTSMLISQFHDPERRELWPLLLSSLLSGYHNVSPLDRVECEAVLPVLLAIEFIFLAFSCRSGRFDAGRCNEAAIVWLLENRSRIEEATMNTVMSP